MSQLKTQKKCLTDKIVIENRTTIVTGTVVTFKDGPRNLALNFTPNNDVGQMPLGKYYLDKCDFDSCFLDHHFVRRKLLGSKIIWTQNDLGPKILLGSNIFGPKLFWIQNFI